MDCVKANLDAFPPEIQLVCAHRFSIIMISRTVRLLYIQVMFDLPWICYFTVNFLVQVEPLMQRINAFLQ